MKHQRKQWKAWLVEFRENGKIIDIATYPTRAHALRCIDETYMQATKPVAVTITLRTGR